MAHAAGILRVILSLLCSGWVAAHPASATPVRPFAAVSQPTAGFDASRLLAAERRILQIALAAEGEYRGPLDGIWTEASEAALLAYARREFASPAEETHVAALVLNLLAEIDTRGWRFQHLPDVDLSLALPEKLFGTAEAEDAGRRWWSGDGSLTLLAHDFGEDLARSWHVAARSANQDATVLEVEDSADRLASRGVLLDGRRFATVSIRRGTQWPTVYLASEADTADAMAFILASLVGGAADAWEMPLGGRLEAIIHETLAAFGKIGAFDAFLPPTPARATPPDGAGLANGTAFYVGRHVLLTANHVVADCRRIALADGTGLRVLAADPDLDVAALRADGAAPAWLSLSPEARERLGQRLHAVGYPYYNIAGTSLHLTTGNVSSLADVNDDRRFFGFSAPVQPGNSGGPLLDAAGGVIGLVVSRLSERYIAETTGSLPQNMNYGLTRMELAEFLRRNGILAEPSRLAPFDMESGAPEGFEAAIVPVVCN